MERIAATTLYPPMFISGRLMAAVRLADGSVIHIEPLSRDHEDRVVWHYVIEDKDRHVLDEAADVRTGSGDTVDPRKAMATLVGFLDAAADAYRRTIAGQHSENTDMFPPEAIEWAYEHDDDLANLALDLDQIDPRDPDLAARDKRWHEVWGQTGCADCAAAAAENRPWGPDHCWATHRPHRPVTDRTLTDARRQQGFISQTHLDAFFAYYDHVANCADCQRPGPPEPIDDGMQPTRLNCPTGRDLFSQFSRKRWKAS